MARLLISTIAILLVVLPALVAASACTLSVSSKLSESQSRYNLYEGTITNVGSAAAADISISSSVDLRSVSGLKDKSNNAYSLPKSQTKQGGIAAGATYSFTYTVAKGKTVQWSTSCTDGAASGATAAPTAKAATSAPTSKGKTATTAPSKAATSAPTSGKAATSAPTSGKTATTAPTTKTGSTNGRLCPAGAIWSPAPQTTWQWQIDGTVDTSINVQMYDIDLFSATPALISTLHSQGRAVVCYFSTQYENWRPDASSFTSAVLGKNLDDWAGEKWVDVRSTVVRNIMQSRLDLALSKGCDGVEPDNVDGYQASTGFPLTQADTLDFTRFIAAQAHARGLSVGLKNTVDLVSTLQPAFDWALNEQCKQYSECGGYSAFINAGKAVFNAEYSGSASSVCPSMVTAKISSLIKSLDLDASIKAQCCTYQSNGCAAVPYSCKSVSKRSIQEVDAVEVTEAVELTTQEVPAASSATSSFASIAFVAVAAVAAMNL